eukprot:TRINITY_DN2305_c0_g1_i5.p3 TRINITY_DN2305_c0_g1~~TRINITY_DN2305_c0_g1_i5.p3  ORF type:complete len:241 (-),score=65.02 TRINITY_DN2305_c0_g1_i5:1067-1789(-)
MLRDDYLSKALPNVKIRDGVYEVIPEFDEEARQSLKKWEDLKHDLLERPQMRSFGNTKRGQKIVEDQQKREDTEKKKKKEEARKKQQEEEKARKLDEEKQEMNEKAEAKKRLANRFNKKGKGKEPSPKMTQSSPKMAQPSPKKEREDRNWGTSKKVTKRDIEALDHSTKSTLPDKPVKKDDYFDEDDDPKWYRSDDESIDLSDEEETKEIKEEKKSSRKNGSILSLDQWHQELYWKQNFN